jgi:hypothetical protein
LLNPNLTIRFDHKPRPTTSWAAYLTSEALEKRLAQLFRRIGDGEELTVSEAADFMFLPVEVFRHVWAAVLATEHEAS